MRGKLSSQVIVADARVARMVFWLMAAGFALLLAAGGAVVWSLGQNQRHQAALAHTYRVIQQLADYQAEVERAETARRGMLLSPNPRFVGIARTARARGRADLDRLAGMIADNPTQLARLPEVRRVHASQDLLLARTIGASASGRIEQAIIGFETDGGFATIDRSRALLAAMQAEEIRLLDVRSARLADSTRVFVAIMIAAGLLLALVAVASLAVIRRAFIEAGRAHRDLETLNAGLEDAVGERTRDLSRANEEIQRFAYIVSHDLRSPLVNVMGFTSEMEAAIRPLAVLIDRVEADAPALLTADARLAAREDLPEAVGFIRSSTEKMDRLINAILQLSRQGRRTLAPEPIDLAALVAGIVDSMAHRIDAIGAVVAIDAPLPALVSDRLAIEQILSNLIENATKYRDPARPLRVTVTGQEQGRRVVLSVIDNGRGIDPRDHQRIFDLFRRSGAQTEPGEGIGLAHVRALAYRLGGTIDCISELGQGATFRLMLPAVFEGEAGISG